MRRPLGEDLDAQWGGLSAPDSVLAVFELVGFQPYHDNFGVLAGEAMLERLHQRLAESVRAWGRAYRLEHDGFAVLAALGGRGPHPIVAPPHPGPAQHRGALPISPVHGNGLGPSAAAGPPPRPRAAP